MEMLSLISTITSGLASIMMMIAIVVLFKEVQNGKKKRQTKSAFVSPRASVL